MAVARLSGWAKLGTPLCPSWVVYINPNAKQCTVNASGADDLSLSTGKGTLSGTFAVVVQGDNTVDAAEFVIMTGTFTGDADLSLAFSGKPLGYITNGVGHHRRLMTGRPSRSAAPSACPSRSTGRATTARSRRTAAPTTSATTGTPSRVRHGREVARRSDGADRHQVQSNDLRP